jgi:ABC-2 type transport system permease protein
MKRISFLLQKEFTQIFRNKAMLPLIFVMPIVQLLVLVNAADFEIKNVRLSIIDEDRTEASRRLVSKFEHSTQFNVSYPDTRFESSMNDLDMGKTDLVLRIKRGFGRDLELGKPSKIMFDVDGIDGQKAGVSYNYAMNTVDQYYRELQGNTMIKPQQALLSLNITNRYWYNPELEYKNLMVPGLLAVLVSMIGMFLSSMNIVREKEIGTIEQLNVTPITKLEFIIGKLMPFWIICLFELTIGLFLGWLIFDIPIVGSLPLLFAFASVYFLVMLGLGLLISTFTNTQQQAMFISWFFLVIFILMGGLFTAIENMPDWARKITWFNPASYFIEVLRMVLLKGSGFADISRHFIIMAIMAFSVNTIAVMKYSKRSA